jgi:Holliday junction DNA helicase RuvA
VIGRLRGQLLEKSPGRLLIDVQGVGYQVHVSVLTWSALPGSGSEVTLDIHTHVREDAILLYGFASRLERSVFERLTEISGIGPRLALTILSGSPVEGLIASIRKGDLARLTSIPGVGKKTAERIVLELRDKMREFVVAEGSQGSGGDVASALENLGYSRGQVEGAIRRAIDGGPDPGFEELFRRTLRILTGG